MFTVFTPFVNVNTNKLKNVVIMEDKFIGKYRLPEVKKSGTTVGLFRVRTANECMSDAKAEREAEKPENVTRYLKTQGVSNREIAMILKVSEGSIRNWLKK